MKIAARTVPLGKNGLVRLKFDYEDGLYRVALYWPKLNGQRQTGENRTAVKHKELGQALQVVLGEAELDQRFDPLTVETYMRETAWGRELP